MPSVDDLLRQAFDAPDDEWVRRAPPARDAVLSRHRRHRVVRRSTAGVLVAACLVVAVSIVDGERRTRGAEPAEPPPTSSTAVASTPLEGTWTSETLDVQDVRSAARRAGAPGAAERMIGELPDGSFRVVLVVRGSSLRTLIRSAGGRDTVVDEETISTTRSELELRPVRGEARTVHAWTLDGSRLTVTFGSTTEGTVDGVPGEAWQRLLYATTPFSR